MNKLMNLFNMDAVAKLIVNCPKNEIVILLPHYSINKPVYTDDEYLNGTDTEDWNDMENLIGFSMSVNDYDDLICDPHNILND